MSLSINVNVKYDLDCVAPCEVIEGGKEVYDIDAKKISKHRLHIILPAKACGEMLVVAHLWAHFQLLSSRSTRRKFCLDGIVFKNMRFLWASFPVNFLSVCKAIAETYGMTIEHRERPMVGLEVKLILPKSDNLLIFKGKCNVPIRSIMEYKDLIVKSVVEGKKLRDSGQYSNLELVTVRESQGDDQVVRLDLKCQPKKDEI